MRFDERQLQFLVGGNYAIHDGFTQPFPISRAAHASFIHREALARASMERQELASKQSTQIFELSDQNTKLTRITQELTQRIKELTDEIHNKVAAG